MRVNYYFPDTLKYKSLDTDWRTYYFQLVNTSKDIKGLDKAVKNYWFGVVDWLIKEFFLNQDVEISKILETMDPSDSRYLKMLKFLDERNVFYPDDVELFFHGLETNSIEILQFLHDKEILRPGMYNINDIDNIYSDQNVNPTFDIINWLNQYKYITPRQGLEFIFYHFDVSLDLIPNIKQFIVQNNISSLNTLNLIQNEAYKGQYELTKWMIEDLKIKPNYNTLVNALLGKIINKIDESFETFKYLYELGYDQLTQNDINRFYINFPSNPTKKDLGDLDFMWQNGMKPDERTIDLIFYNQENYGTGFPDWYMKRFNEMIEALY